MLRARVWRRRGENAAKLYADLWRRSFAHTRGMFLFIHINTRKYLYSVARPKGASQLYALGLPLPQA